MKTHETQEDKPVPDIDPGFQPAFEEAQRTEGGGPPKKVGVLGLPKPVLIFGYIMFGIFVLMLAAALVSSVLK